MKYTCARCKNEFDYTAKSHGGYSIDRDKDLCPKCWGEYIEIKNRQYKELSKWWRME